MTEKSTRAAVKVWFESNGMSVSDWAAANGFSRDAVYAILNGRTAGRRGDAHRIAVALGLKSPISLPLAPTSTVRPDARDPDSGKNGS